MCRRRLRIPLSHNTHRPGTPYAHALTHTGTQLFSLLDFLFLTVQSSSVDTSWLLLASPAASSGIPAKNKPLPPCLEDKADPSLNPTAIPPSQKRRRRGNNSIPRHCHLLPLPRALSSCSRRVPNNSSTSPRGLTCQFAHHITHRIHHGPSSSPDCLLIFKSSDVSHKVPPERCCLPDAGHTLPVPPV